MDKRTTRTLSLVMCLAVMLTLCIGSIAPAFATDDTSGTLSEIMEGGVMISSGDTIEADGSTTYILPRIGNEASEFKIDVPAKGYLTLDMRGYTYWSHTIPPEEYFSGVDFRAGEYNNFEYVNEEYTKRFVAVRKGTYTFHILPYSDNSLIKAKYTRVKESKFGTQKKKAAAIKKKKTAKGLVIVNENKPHWYKIRIKKAQKVRLVVKGFTSGGSSSGIRFRFFDKNKALWTANSRFTPPGGTVTCQFSTPGKGGRLAKGTYWIKVYSYNKGNGYYSIKWK